MYGTRSHGKRSNKTACAQQRPREYRDGGLLLLLSTTSMRVGNGQWSRIHRALVVLGAEIGLVFAFLTEVLSVTSVRGLCLNLRSGGERERCWRGDGGCVCGGGRLIVKSAPRKTANQLKGQQIDVAARAMSSTSHDGSCRETWGKKIENTEERSLVCTRVYMMQHCSQIRHFNEFINNSKCENALFFCHFILRDYVYCETV